MRDAGAVHFGALHAVHAAHAGALTEVAKVLMVGPRYSVACTAWVASPLACSAQRCIRLLCQCLNLRGRQGAGVVRARQARSNRAKVDE